MATFKQQLKALSSVLIFAAVSAAAPVPVLFDSALVEIIGPAPLPIELDGFPNNLRLRFHVPSAANIAAINSLSISVDVYDDGDPADNEEADLVFVLQASLGPNFIIDSFGPGLNGTTLASPLTLTGNLTAGDLIFALDEIQDDGYFLVRVNRNSGDFLVGSASATLDAQLVPEPSSAGLALVGVSFLLLRRKRSNK